MSDYAEAKETIDEATKIWHNYHRLMLYNALCTFAISETVELIFKDKAIDKIKKLVEVSKKIKEDNLFKLITFTIANSFYSLIESNVRRLDNDTPKESRNWRFVTKDRIEYYRYAMARHINRLEFCYEIYSDINYLKKCVEYLSGHRGFAWVVLDENANIIDLNDDFFEDGVIKKRNDLISQIKLEEPNYQVPDLWFGGYNEDPLSKAKYLRNRKRHKMLFVGLVIFLILIILIIKILDYFNWDDFISFLLLFIPLFLLFHPFGNNRLSAVQKITRYIYKSIAQ